MGHFGHYVPTGSAGDTEPDVKTIWLGLQRVTDFAAGIRFAREL